MLTRVWLSLVFCSLVACGGNTRAPVEDRYARTQSSSSTYAVQGGDTLYSIAFRYGLDYRKVASANGIPAPYTIYPGQTIALKEAPLPAKRATAAKPAPTPAPKKSSSPKVYPTASASVPKTVAVTRSSSSSVKKNSNSVYTGSAVGAWRWPTSGRVTRGYSSSVHKGIDIAGRRGDPIQAVAAGKVVYAGTGIVGFGELVIVKHNEVYLSAYGHNDRLLVAEGDTVGAGQKIAQKGSSGTDTVKLHFEIRKEGKPVDPQRLLPRR